MNFRRGRRGVLAADDSGASLVEAALALPILFLLLSGAVDLGLWAFGNTQVANAARDGARIALLHYSSADSYTAAFPAGFTNSSNLSAYPDDQAIQTAISGHLSNTSFTATVACVTFTKEGVTSAVTCSQASLGSDLIKVTVVSPRKSYSFIGPKFGSSKITRSSLMTIVGLPVTTTTSSSTTTPPTTTSSTTTTTACTAPSVTSPTSSAPAMITNGQTGTFTIMGSNLQNGASVTISPTGGFDSPTVVWNSTSSLSVTVKAKNGKQGTYDFTVANPCGASVTVTGGLKNV